MKPALAVVTPRVEFQSHSVAFPAFLASPRVKRSRPAVGAHDRSAGPLGRTPAYALFTPGLAGLSAAPAAGHALPVLFIDADQGAEPQTR